MAHKNRVQAVSLSSFNAASLSGTYQAINSTGLSNACVILKIVNENSTGITISYDGINDHEYLPGTAAAIPRETLLLDFSGGSHSGSEMKFAKGTVVYVKGTAGVGTIYLSGYYHDENGA